VDPFSPILINLLIVVVGLALGSFTTAMVHRIPLNKKITGKERSACPQCNHTLAPVDLIPVLSWLSTGGKCRYCKKDIGMSYPMIELAVVLACLIVYWVKGWNVETAFIIAAVPFLMALLVIDLRHMILPDGLLIILALIGVGRLIYKAVFLHSAPDMDMFVEYIFSILTFGGISFAIGFVMEKIMKRDALGMGDVKFFAMAGVWLGLSQLGAFCVISGFLGVLFVAIFRNVYKGKEFPFGPALIASLFALILVDGSLF
jgi:leader peptidase (prepilin peptidase) / N-methyltransferase